MLVEDVAKLEPIQRFHYWMVERHQIHIRRERLMEKPWTDDKVLQTNFFTNPYRENDKVTVWFRDNIRDPLRNSPEVLMATIIFRWFNRITTGELLLEKGQLTRWREKRTIAMLERARKNGPVFTGAFMIKVGNGPPGSKIRMVCEAITALWKDRKNLVSICEEEGDLQSLWLALKTYRGLGGFMSYEIVCDLRYTYLLENATDKFTWCNLGPGAVRGLARLNGTFNDKTGFAKLERGWMDDMLHLLAATRKKLVQAKKMPSIEMREIEHSLCEWDKYERARLGQGKMKRKYNATGVKGA
jgi:hypothetical protein